VSADPSNELGIFDRPSDGAAVIIDWGMFDDLAQRLEGRIVVLEPLGAEHVEGLRAAAADERIWSWMITRDVEAWIEDALRAEGRQPFAVLRDGVVVGSTSYMSLPPEHRRLEIGNTWMNPCTWSTGANVEAKYLLLRHAFETLGCRRVEFKTDALNERARAALAAIPAEFEGIHRKHMVVRGGERRDSAWYAVIDDDWPMVRAALERRLEGQGLDFAAPGIPSELERTRWSRAST
jgi:N-acetyltransferase